MQSPRSGRKIARLEATMNNDIFFKYRSLQNWKFVLDIFIKKRLYAAVFKEMNDPMEGRYFYASDPVSLEFGRAMRRQKKQSRICSLSRNPRNTLMWSYYADGHKGIAVGINVRNLRKNAYLVRDVRYDMEVNLDRSKIRAGPKAVALDILSQKQYSWRHEEEVRVFSGDHFVDIDIQQIYFGCLIDRTERDLITALVKMTAPRAKLAQLKRSQLDKPLDTFAA